MLTFPLLRRICISSSVLYIINQCNPDKCHEILTLKHRMPKDGMLISSWLLGSILMTFRMFLPGMIHIQCRKHLSEKMSGESFVFLSRCLHHHRFRPFREDYDKGYPIRLIPIASHMPPMIKATDKIWQESNASSLKKWLFAVMSHKKLQQYVFRRLARVFFGCVPHFSSEAPKGWRHCRSVDTVPD